ncbi:hypothetical protein P175DRAFT_0499269 [Aspergillus ochraceoroseus IBT 24754]|uniref:ACB domain-containing protein n=1 Tax=Aspergillus ochraceoroseus IBT 24754 TaxID=1392256 RepID=A0A2T5M2F6_9EURO|nr:uncharacterized protein P175DRAFT_0499269 [Aspergillus ochraceoroseus IBT 24754]PTU22723.1 hypothetical protein P175DRAFT_0499269 [Aspergillus ochraceoroseus IBT 24754]
MSDSVDRVFVHALNTVKRIPRTGTVRPPASERLKLYGLYKQSMEGDVEGVMDRPVGNTADVYMECEKWDAWFAQRGLSRTEAKRRYISTLIETMHNYASQTAEARELVSELEFVWDQVRSNMSSSSPSSAASARSPARSTGFPLLPQSLPSYGSIGVQSAQHPEYQHTALSPRGDSRLRVLSPVSQPDDIYQRRAARMDYERAQGIDRHPDDGVVVVVVDDDDDDGDDDVDHDEEDNLEIDEDEEDEEYAEAQANLYEDEEHEEHDPYDDPNAGGDGGGVLDDDDTEHEHTHHISHHSSRKRNRNRNHYGNDHHNPDLDPYPAEEDSRALLPTNYTYGGGMLMQQTKDDVDSRRWRRRVEQALTKMTAEIAAAREQMEARALAHRRRSGVWAWLRWLVWVTLRQIVWDLAVLGMLLIWMRLRRDPRLEEKLRAGWSVVKARLLSLKALRRAHTVHVSP